MNQDYLITQSPSGLNAGIDARGKVHAIKHDSGRAAII
jgi:hypothetical protein